MKNISKGTGSKDHEEEIRVLGTLKHTDNPEILKAIILKLDGRDIRVRGEAFSSLVLNKNEISSLLIDALSSASENIRGFTSLILANRDETVAIPEIIKLARDEHPMVRACAIGALGYLKAGEARRVFLESLSDSDLEVRKSALQAVIDLNIIISEDMREEMSKEGDSEMEGLLFELKNSGPEGI